MTKQSAPPHIDCHIINRTAPVAQMDRAIASGAIGREFESLRAHQIFLADNGPPRAALYREFCHPSS